MRYKRDLRGIKLRQQRDAALNTLSKIPKKIPPWGWLLLLIFSLLLFTCFYMGSNIFSDPEYVQLDNSTVADRNIKQVVINSDVSETESVANNEKSSTSTDVNLGQGKLVTDTAKNPLGLPIYDGYTHEGEYFDVDFSRFWNSGDVMSGLGDYDSTEKSHIISFEGASNSKVKPLEQINQYRTYEGRIVVALAPGVIIDPEIYEPMIDSFWANPDKYTYRADWTKGTSAIVYKSGIWDKRQIGMYVDCVLEDGTVIALVLGDEKALHKGLYSNNEYCFDYEMKGYAHVRQGKNSSSKTYSIIELCGSGNGKKAELNLAGNRIVKFRCYKDTMFRYGA